MKSFYVYSHTRNDTGTVFYIGVSRKGKNNRSTAIRGKHRTSLWHKIHQECGEDITVDVLAEFDRIEDAHQMEVNLIKHYGRIVTGDGILANITTGGRFCFKPRKQVLQYNLFGDFIKIWDNIDHAASENGTKFQTISASIIWNRPFNNSLWRYNNGDFKTHIEPYVHALSKVVYQFDLTGKFVCKYKSMADASRKTKIDRSSINHCCIGNRISCGGFLWSYNKEVSVPKRRIIIQYDMQGNIVGRFSTVEDIRKMLGVTSTTAIRNCFAGIQHQAYGFVWKEIK